MTYDLCSLAAYTLYVCVHILVVLPFCIFIQGEPEE